ncbi:iron-containing alcohol dehydrogenase [Sinorhizobium medicae]|uniref:iron-containing alcohol dehydrogenase n=1 Tax=Sinorhizobium medicae TaxID=110321 RepID=UPI00041E07A4|nr:iron-containing alcohol dehydrogenase [Sinorhizobium medicae]MBO1944811.1 iron-containing alcohol dehydrogenase [Sinorhizobium medicae]MDX0436425.1 iron-containing alcohol dehydrogenase [Sinorhizobium medicae]MDX0445425.1 iron-containing alcohol dehydrogenase [Sinorhizobium medicae]MDX0463540.1 iron-containing alcohol dehydrogenase [Sinorhizobium medicae]MDX0488024.1 iron-containing alcohol dehydrogenase [Sinorhizobium medicae]
MEKIEFLPQDNVIWGRGVLAGALGQLRQYGIERPIVFTVEPLDALRRCFVVPNLPDGVGTYLDLPPHVPDFAVNQALYACEASGAKSIVAVGGGSVLDAAKAVSHFHQVRHGTYLPIAALPTTLSGSEFSHYFGVTETAHEKKFKRSYAVKPTVPRVVIVDPELIRGTPRALLLSSAIKGVDHAVEGMRLVGPDHPHAILAASGVRRFLGVLTRWPVNVETEEALQRCEVDLDDLLQLQLAAWQCYFFPASVIYGLSHRIGHILGGSYGVPHSVTSCVTLVPVIRACSAFYGEKLRIFNDAVSGVDAASRLSAEIEAVVLRLGLPNRLRDLKFDHDELPAVARLLVENYPREVADLGEGAAQRLANLLERLW